MHVLRRNGLVLIAVLVIVALASMIAAGLLFRMTAEVSATAAGARGRQAYAAALSGLQQAMTVLAAHADEGSYWLDNPAVFRDQLVCDDGANRWYFTIFADSLSEPGEVRYGPTDEGGKINLNAASAEALSALPGMAPELSACLMDWRDADSQTSPDGAEQDYYDNLPQPYACHNGPLASLDELLLIKGFNARIVYGSDANQNGLLDANEDDGDATFPPDESTGQFFAGLRDIATVFSYQPRDKAGAKVNINDPSAKLEGTGLPDQTIEFIRLYVGDGNKFSHPSELLEMPRYQLKKDPGGADGKRPASDGQNVPSGSQQQPSDGPAAPQVQAGPDGSDTGNPPSSSRGSKGSRGRKGRRSPQGGPTPQPPAQDGGSGGASPQGPKAGDWIESGVGAAELPIVMEKLTTDAAARGRIVGLVNVNTAPVGVLALLPGMNADLARQVADLREGLTTETKANLAWLYTEGALDAETFKAAAPLLTTRSLQFHVRCVGYGSPAGRFRVLEAVLDLAGPTPRILYLRDLTGLGLPMPMNPDQTER